MSGFSKDAKRSFVMEWSGGIGDVFYMMWVSGYYALLDDLKEGEYATIINRCRTPGLEEIIKWHPNRDRIELIDLSWHPHEVTSVEKRKVLGLPLPSPHTPLLKEPVFYPSPEDAPVLRELTSSPFVVFALSGSFSEKNVPPQVGDRIAAIFLSRGYRVIQVGKTYSRRVCYAGTIVFTDRREERLTKRDGVVDVIDGLTLPGTCELVRAAAGVVCCDSSIMHLSLRMQKPTFIVVPDKWFNYWNSVDAASWGKKEPKAGYTRVSDYTDDFVVRWMDRTELIRRIR